MMRQILNKVQWGSALQISGAIVGLVILQQLIDSVLFGADIDWSAVPRLALVNAGIVAFWFYIRDPGKKLPAFITVTVAIVLAMTLRVFLFYLGAFRFVSPIVIAFIEKQLNVLIYFWNMPQFIPTMFAAAVMLLLMKRVGIVYRRLISN